MDLQTTVDNAVATESNLDIKTKAPQAYYTNNRMITPEDYQITPLIENPSIAKSKSQMRTSSGISRFLDVVDPTGVYSQTDIFSDEGIDMLAKISAEVNSSVENIGARRLHTIIEKVLDDISFNATDKAGETIIVDEKFVKENLGNLVKDTDLSKFIL